MPRHPAVKKRDAARREAWFRPFIEALECGLSMRAACRKAGVARQSMQEAMGKSASVKNEIYRAYNVGTRMLTAASHDRDMPEATRVGAQYIARNRSIDLELKATELLTNEGDKS
jgi:lambda repressor-like predicted transcriptional regulator